ncbi:CshA/CshB family fibrillar adhesin-related protein [Dyadobacter sp. CY312]|uniref:CshA/CshB family fibrillar adhesin-related protein n=1 Tax=Dyadobacter sp. CY312 TaxID=2907303 RepID=UPI001F29BEFC|nr:CshA/CshB family fibrillar adhesin-related protein [Dyadobacter sp. CY312]MCE7044215.1 CshA/CshB family fibrillar adhesin-related protein [Dyadobacter sp. CY312]
MKRKHLLKIGRFDLMSAKKVVFLHTFLYFFCIHINVSGQAVKATGGSGAYRNSIWWLNFAGMGEIPAGGSFTRNFTVNGVAITVLLDNISFGGLTPAAQRLIAYTPGGWVGDGFDNMYNIGGADATNTLAAGLSGKLTGTYSDNGQVVIINFRIRAYADINGQPMDLGLVFANAEDDATISYQGTPLDEFEQASTNGSTWQLLESKNNAGVPANKKITFFGANTFARISAGSQAIYTGSVDPTGGNVAVMYTKKLQTTAANPLESIVGAYGAGRAAIALGIVIDNDLGDAPATYGNPSNIYFADAIGGNPSGTTSHNEYLSAGGSAPGGAIVINAGTLSVPSTPRMGTNLTDSDPVMQHSIGADGDNNAGLSANDEDALSSIPAINTTTTSYSLSVPFTTGTLPAFITGWVDFNRNGFFDPSEFASAQVAANTITNATLSWPTILPGTIIDGTTYIRLRISNFDSRDVLNDLPGTPEDERSIIVLNNGETEDYVIQTALPVNLVSFAVKAEGQTTQISWSTTEETNSDRFEIEYRMYGRNWDKVGVVASNRESREKKNYSFIHATPSNGENLYRLKMIDKDGSFAYSRIRSVKFEQALELTAYPNPVREKLLIKNYDIIKEVTLYNISGLVVYSGMPVFAQGIDVSRLSAGLYHLKITLSDGTQSVQKIVIAR